MPNDQFGRPIAVGDTVTMTGEVTKVVEDPNFVNCTVNLQQSMPPSGTETNLQLNTAQLTKKGGGNGGGKSGGQQEHSQQPQPSHGAQPTKK